MLLAACSSGDGAPEPAAATTTTTTIPATTSTNPVPTTTAAGPTTTSSATRTTTTVRGASGGGAPVPAEVTVRGVVAAAFASARVVQLAQPVNGIATVALTTETELVRANGARATLGDVTPGATIEAVGRPSTADTVVARRITLV